MTALAPPSSAPSAASPLRVLILGDGNLSFSAAFLAHHNPSRRALKKPRPPNIPRITLTATSFDSREECMRKYPETPTIFAKLVDRQARVRFAIDATKLTSELLADTEIDSGDGRFDWIIFNGPHLGIEDCSAHRMLLSHIFHSVVNVSHPGTWFEMTLCNDQPQLWSVLECADRHGWSLQSVVDWGPEFAEWQQRGYETRRHQNGKTFDLHAVTKRHKFTFTRTHIYTNSDVDSRPPVSANQCPVCDEVFESGKLLAQHCADIVPVDPATVAAQCHQCHRQFANERALSQHLVQMANRTDHVPLGATRGKMLRVRELESLGLLSDEKLAQINERREKHRMKRMKGDDSRSRSGIVAGDAIDSDSTVSVTEAQRDRPS